MCRLIMGNKTIAIQEVCNRNRPPPPPQKKILHTEETKKSKDSFSKFEERKKYLHQMQNLPTEP